MAMKKPPIEEIEQDLKKFDDIESVDDLPEDEAEEVDEVAEGEDILAEDEEAEEAEVEESEPDEEENEPEDPDVEDELKKVKKRYSDSSREAHMLYKKTQKWGDTVKKAKEIDVTEEDLRARYSDWDTMTDLEQDFAKSNLINEKRFGMINEVFDEFENITQWNERVDEYLNDPRVLAKFPDLEGMETEFSKYVNTAGARGQDLEGLTKQFLFDAPRGTKRKATLFESSSGGANKGKAKDKKIGLSNADSLMRTNYKDWKDAVIKGKTDTTV